MKINGVDIGYYATDTGRSSGGVVGSITVEGYADLAWHRGSIVRKRTETIYVEAQVAIGGFAAGTPAAAELVMFQLLELAGNAAMNPVYVQWRASAKNAAFGGNVNATSPDDGFWNLESLVPDQTNAWSSSIQCTAIFNLVSLSGAAQQGIWWAGGGLSTTYTGGTQNVVAYPQGATAVWQAITRTGAEGAISLTGGTSSSVLYFSPATSNPWAAIGGCHLFDQVSTGNAVPTNGTFAHANWVEVKGSDHRFVGNAILTNGFLLFVFTTSTNTYSFYFWDTIQAKWVVISVGMAHTTTPLAITTIRVSPPEVTLIITCTDFQYTYRLLAGQLYVRVDARVLTGATSTNYMLSFGNMGAAVAWGYNSGTAIDFIIAGNPNEKSSLAATTDYGFSGFYGTTTNWLAGFLYQNPPANQLRIDNGNLLSLGDNTSLANNASRTYGIFALTFPEAPSIYSQLGSTGTLSGGFTTAAIGSGSSLTHTGTVAKLPSGTVAGAIDTTVGTATVLNNGPNVFQCIARVGVTANNSSTNQIQFTVRDVTGASNLVGPIIFSPNALTAGWAWVKIGGTFNWTVAHTVAVKIDNIGLNTATTDFFIDQLLLVPLDFGQITGPLVGPSLVWQQFMFDKSSRLVVL